MRSASILSFCSFTAVVVIRFLEDFRSRRKTLVMASTIPVNSSGKRFHLPFGYFLDDHSPLQHPLQTFIFFSFPSATKENKASKLLFIVTIIYFSWKPLYKVEAFLTSW